VVVGCHVQGDGIVHSNPEASNIASYDPFRKFFDESLRFVGRAICGISMERLRATQRAVGVEDDHLGGLSAVPKGSEVRDVRVRAELVDFQVHDRLRLDSKGIVSCVIY
jgi:hypothetical protein